MPLEVLLEPVDLVCGGGRIGTQIYWKKLRFFVGEVARHRNTPRRVVGHCRICLCWQQGWQILWLRGLATTCLVLTGPKLWREKSTMWCDGVVGCSWLCLCRWESCWRLQSRLQKLFSRSFHLLQVRWFLLLISHCVQFVNSAQDVDFIFLFWFLHWVLLWISLVM